ncbi:MAG: hypothetical protein M1421_00070 [Candidatus Eremiobacteraeota bacterium]|nr:hypothetical protein [Candidatus Eremiobacteraeota bacterium]MCL5055458.1 hypothetical protein [Bacillota bacterium]
MRTGLTLLEVLISLVLLTLFILGGMSLYASSITQTKRSRLLLTELWLAKGKLDLAAETHTTFSSPFQSYSWRIKKQSIPNEPDLTVLTITVSGPDHTKVTLERIVEK